MGERIIKTIATIIKMACAPPPLSLLSRERLAPPPYHMAREPISASKTSAPSMIPAVVISATSRFLMWPIS